MRPVVGLLVIVLLLSGCTAPGQPRLPQAQTSAETELAAGAFLEVNLQARGGTEIQYNWTSHGAPLEFDAHVHDEQGVEYLERGQHASRAGHVTARAGGVSFLWQNPSDGAATLHYELAGRFRIASIHGD